MQAIPMAPGLPLIGSTRPLLEDPLAFMVKGYHDLGPIFRVKALDRDYIVLAGPEANRFFVEHAEEVMEGHLIYKPYIDDIGSEKVLVAMEGDEHRAYRRFLRPAFSREMVSRKIPRLIAECDAVIDGWQPGEQINVGQIMEFFMAQLMGLSLTGCPVDHHVDDVRTFGRVFLGAGVGGFPDFMRHLPHYRRARGATLDFVSEILAEREQADPHTHDDLLDILLSADLTHEDRLASAHMPFSNTLVYASAVCGFMLYELLKHPTALARVREELDVLFADGQPDIRALWASRWLRGALLETHRMHPVALSMPRVVTHPFTFAGHRVEPGTAVLTATAVTHYLEEIFPDPYTFDITRYSAPRSEHKQPYMLVAYGLGPRACIAAGAVDSVVMLTVGRLLQRVEFDIGDYDLSLTVMPFPAPERSFSLRVEGSRTPQPSSDDVVSYLADALPAIDVSSIGDLADHIQQKQVEAGSVIIEEGGPADAFYILKRGRVEVTQAGRVVGTIESGGYFGEMGLINDAQRSATCMAQTDVELLVLDRTAFTNLVATSDLTSAEIAAVIQQRRAANALMDALPGLRLGQVPDAQIKGFASGDAIVREGDEATTFYVLLEGHVTVLNHHPAGREIVLNVLGPGDFFGEIGLMQQRPRTATVRAASPVRVLAIGREAFATMLSQSHAASDQLAVTMLERLTRLAE